MKFWKKKKIEKKNFLEKNFVGQIVQIGGHFVQIGLMDQIWHQNRIFSGKMTILSYKTIFGPTFSAILENLFELFFRNVQKTAILAKNGPFLA